MVQRAFRIHALKSPFCTQSILTFFFYTFSSVPQNRQDGISCSLLLILCRSTTVTNLILFGLSSHSNSSDSVLSFGSSPLVESDSAKPGVAAFEAISFNNWHQPLWKLKDLRSLKQRLKAGQTRNLCHWWPVPSSCFHRTNCLPPFSSARVSYEILSKVFSLFLMTS